MRCFEAVKWTNLESNFVIQVDKAHPDVLTTLLQLFDEGRLTDGKVVKFRGPLLNFKSQ